MRAEALYRTLDGQAFAWRSRRWVASILGIHADNDEAWIQLVLFGHVHYSLIVHLAPHATAAQTTAAIAAWLGSAPADRSRVVEVS